MTLDELREIRERISLKISSMSWEEQKAYFKKGADEIEKRMADRKKDNENKNADAPNLK